MKKYIRGEKDMGIKAFEDTGLKGMHKSSDEGFVAIGQKDRWM